MSNTFRASAIVLFLGAAIPQLSHASTIYTVTTFSVPGAIDTVSSGVDNSGAIVGSYDDAGGLHGFIRDAQGTITKFDAPSATLTLGFDTAAGVTVGSFIDSSGSTDQAGYIRAADGTFTTFSAPGNVGDTVPVGINTAGLISGFIEDEATGHRSSFLRNIDGSLVIFGVAGSTRTEASKINDNGVITGVYQDGTGFHGFLRSATGVITSFDLPGPLALQGPGQLGLNDQGQVAGKFVDGQGTHGFVRNVDGSFTTLDFPGLANVSAFDINDSGVVVGYFEDGNENLQSFIASPVPEPGSLALAAGGIFAAIFLRRRRT